MQGTSIVKNSVKILLCLFLLLVLISGVQAAETYQFITKWGTFGTNDGEFSTPSAIALDSSGYVYVTDGSNRIQKFSSDGQFIKKWGSTGTGPGQFNGSWGIAVDPQGNVYVSDHYNHRIQKFTSDGNFITQWGSLGTGNGQFDRPYGIAVDSSGNVYVVDQFNIRIQKFTSSGQFITKWGSTGSGDGQFSGSPLGIAIDPSGNVYVTEGRSVRIQKFSPSGQFISTVLGYDFTNLPELTGIPGITVDAKGNIYTTANWGSTDNSNARKISPTGQVLAIIGLNNSAYDGNNHASSGIAVDPAGYVYVVEYQGYYPAVLKFGKGSPFSVSSITPTTALNSGPVVITDLNGTGFMYGAGVKLTKTGSPDIIATGVNVTPPTKISCTFDLTGKSTGQWNVVVSNPDGTTPTLPNGFTITGVEHPTPQPLSVTAISPSTGTNEQSLSATVTGTGFKPGAVVRLMLKGQPDIVASGVTLTGDSFISCTFDLKGKATGTWDLAVTNPIDGTTSVRSTAFTLTAHYITNTNGTIVVSSTPQDALVYLDGSLKGTGSVTLYDVSPGEHSVKVTKTLYNDYGTDIRVAAGSISYVNAVLTPVSGTILASSNPAGASVLLDGMDKGISPVTLTGISSGSHTVSFTKTGYAPASRVVTMTAGQTMEISVDLTKTGGGWEDWLNTTTLIIIGLIVFILVIIGVLLRKKKNRWDNY